MLHSKKFYMRIRLGGIGPGGWNCPCCGPAPRIRKKYVRNCKKKERALINKILSYSE